MGFNFKYTNLTLRSSAATSERFAVFMVEENLETISS
jgi:hypothetical protein